MPSCDHNILVLLPEKKTKLRCRHCHLAINAEELGESYCPECFAMHGEQRYDFIKIIETENGSVRYRCEECGIIIES